MKNNPTKNNPLALHVALFGDVPLFGSGTVPAEMTLLYRASAFLCWAVSLPGGKPESPPRVGRGWSVWAHAVVGLSVQFRPTWMMRIHDKTGRLVPVVEGICVLSHCKVEKSRKESMLRKRS
jgi:hypothetical protein